MDERYSTYEDFLETEVPPDDLDISYSYLLFIQIYSLFLYHRGRVVITSWNGVDAVDDAVDESLIIRRGRCVGALPLC